ncbi:MAG: Methyltransferase type 11, partial [Actinotalea sp.]|nr:Methyltransferase type 11 [Actinotalea sp.]
LVETRRLLRPGGRLLVHTMPNRAVYDVTYRALRAAWRVAGRRWPADPRNEWEHLMHVNEQTVGSLRRAMRRAGLRDVEVHVGQWVHVDFVPSPRARRLLARLATAPGARRLVAADVWGEARR